MVGSQGSSLGRFLHNAKVVRLGEIKPLTQDLYYLIVGTVDEVLVKDPWSYCSCLYCTCFVEAKVFLAKCGSCKRTLNETLLRYKLVIVMEHEGETERFHFWDSVCIKMFNRSAAETRKQLQDVNCSNQEGVKNMNSFPTCVDELIGKQLALRFKYHLQYHVSENEDIITAIKAKLSTSQNLEQIIDKGKSVSTDTQSQETFPIPSLSQSAEHDPISFVLMTPAKQMTIKNMNDEYANQHVISYQNSSSKRINSEHRDLAMNKYFMNLNDEILAAMVHARCDNINYYDYNY
ncbi:hypothetical protein HKD37_01G001884 [Glycine soja]